jgi:hypothetical protein
MMDRLLELHDSQIAALVQAGDDLIVEFAPAYIHRSQGRSDIDGGSVWLQEARLVIRHGCVKAGCVDRPAVIVEGELTVGSLVVDNGIPIPLDVRESVVLHLMVYPPGETLILCGEGARLELLGEARYLEDFRP